MNTGCAKKVGSSLSLFLTSSKYYTSVHGDSQWARLKCFPGVAPE